MNNENSLSDNKKTIIITGASEGLGYQLAKVLSKENNVVILSNDKEKLELVAKEFNVEYYVCDVTNYEEVEQTIKSILDKNGKVDILINNAGVYLDGDLTECSYEQINNCIDVNTKGPIYTTKTILPHMYKNKSGLIINVCSQASYRCDKLAAVYNASKWAMRGFNQTIQQDASKYGVRVTGVYPGMMKTNIFKTSGNNYDTKNALEPEKVAKAIEFIIKCDNDVLIPEFGIKDIDNF